MTTNPFDIVKSISQTKEYQFNQDYNAWLVNNTFSYYIDTIHFSNMMNIHHNIPLKSQHDYLFAGIPKGKRYSKWAKKETSEDLAMVQEIYKYNSARAREVLKFLSPAQIEEMRKSLYKGGLDGGNVIREIRRGKT